MYVSAGNLFLHGPDSLSTANLFHRWAHGESKAPRGIGTLTFNITIRSRSTMTSLPSSQVSLRDLPELLGEKSAESSPRAPVSRAPLPVTRHSLPSRRLRGAAASGRPRTLTTRGATPPESRSPLASWLPSAGRSGPKSRSRKRLQFCRPVPAALPLRLRRVFRPRRRSTRSRLRTTLRIEWIVTTV